MNRFLLFSLCIALACVACEDNSNSEPSFTYPTSGEPQVLPYNVLKTLTSGVEVRNGGYGSAMVAHPSLDGHFYAMTDRGPNASFTGSAGTGKKFPTPDFTPRIGHFKLTNEGTVELVKEILMKNPAGAAISGLPNPAGKGATGEVPYDLDGNEITNGYDDFGLDGEGLVALKDGGFWVSDEYGPHIVHFDADGKQLERLSPVGINENTDDRKLPAVFARRRANRGMEGLAITPDESTLVGIMQSTLYNPDNSTKDNNITRLVTFDIATGTTSQYLYKQEKNQNSNSEITAISATEFLVIERDGKFYADDATAQKHVYKIDISKATNVGGAELFDNPAGKLIDGKTLEQCTVAEIEAAGILFATKTLVIDMIEKVAYPHDKMEGLWFISNTKLGVLNDDDFATWAIGGEVIQKTLPPTNNTAPIDGNKLYVMDVNL